MTNGAACPTPFVLSQFCDHELEEREERRITLHLSQCSDCHEQV
jgi:hypothetical protein